jgi:hypothetical protein
MAHPPPYPDSGDDTGVGSDRGSTTGTPRWVSVVGIIIVIGLLVLFVVLHLTGTFGPGAN